MELFAGKGPDGATAEEIVSRAGAALRTFYRYFRGKQDAVGPLLASGADRWRELLAHSDAVLPHALEEAAVASLSPPAGRGPGATDEGPRWIRALLRAARDDPALRAARYRVNQESEEKLLPVPARLAGPSADPLEIRLMAASATDAIRVAPEVWAETDAGASGEGSPAALTARCMRTLTGGMAP